jgi:hypothetical protein
MHVVVAFTTDQHHWLQFSCTTMSHLRILTVWIQTFLFCTADDAAAWSENNRRWRVFVQCQHWLKIDEAQMRRI